MRCIPLVKHFIGVMFYYKVNFIFTFGVPIFSIIYSLRHDFFQHPSVLPVMDMVLFWTAYMMVLYTLMGSGPSIVQLREDQFIKMFLFITGSVVPIIAAKFLSQLLIFLLSAFILDLISSILFTLPFFSLLGITLIMIFICEIPVYALFLVFAALNIRPETMNPIMNILIFVFIALSMNSFSDYGIIGGMITVMNPISYASHFGQFFLSLIDSNSSFSQLPLIIITTLIYLGIGLLSLVRLKKLPVFRN